MPGTRGSLGFAAKGMDVLQTVLNIGPHLVCFQSLLSCVRPTPAVNPTNSLCINYYYLSRLLKECHAIPTELP